MPKDLLNTLGKNEKNEVVKSIKNILGNPTLQTVAISLISSMVHLYSKSPKKNLIIDISEEMGIEEEQIKKTIDGEEILIKQIRDNPDFLSKTPAEFVEEYKNNEEIIQDTENSIDFIEKYFDSIISALKTEYTFSDDVFEAYVGVIEKEMSDDKDDFINAVIEEYKHLRKESKLEYLEDNKKLQNDIMEFKKDEQVIDDEEKVSLRENVDHLLYKTIEGLALSEIGVRRDNNEEKHFTLTGSHEDSSSKAFSEEVGKRICDRLGIEYVNASTKQGFLEVLHNSLYDFLVKGGQFRGEWGEIVAADNNMRIVLNTKFRYVV